MATNIFDQFLYWRFPSTAEAGSPRAFLWLVAVARIGTTLLDGTNIRRATLRDIDSFGMLLGKTDSEPDVDLTSRYAILQKNTRRGKHFVKWPSIAGFHSLYRGFQRMQEDESYPVPCVTYKAKIKLHGTNAAVNILPDGTIEAQSRTRTLKESHDNCGWWRWVQETKEFWQKVGKNFKGKQGIIFGEWSGPGINKGTAIQKIEKPIFAIFAIQIGDQTMEEATMIVEPDLIQHFLRTWHDDGFELPAHAQVHVLPWLEELPGSDFVFSINFDDPDQVKHTLVKVNRMVDEVELCDPWVETKFGIKGTGEGYVAYPWMLFEKERHEPTRFNQSPLVGFNYDTLEFIEDNLGKYREVTELLFKAKGEKHKVVEAKRPVQMDPEKAKSARAFSELVVTPARLEQGFAEACQGEADMRHTGAFIRWIMADVKKECEAELEESGLTWKMVGKHLTDRARTFLHEKVTSSGGKAPS